MLEKNIEFTLMHPELEYVSEFPSPAIKNLPDWYKDMTSYTGGKKEYVAGYVNHTIKKCIPVLDAMSSGYIIKTWTDVHFSKNEVTWSIKNSPMPAVEGHSLEQFNKYPLLSHYRREAYKWINPWHIRTPKGYSMLFINPIGHHLPFKIIEGVVDTDRFPLTINFPFFLLNSFEGVIPHNTPIVQAIPFKRNSYKSKSGILNETEYQKIKNHHDSKFSNKYKIKWWTRKEYN